MYIRCVKKYLIIILFFAFLFSIIPSKRVVAEWEPALGTMIRWPLGIPQELVIELATEDILYVLVESSNQQNQALNNFNNWGVNIGNIVFINTETYSHWTRDHGPQFIIGEEYWKVVNQQFNGYPEESGCQENFAFEDNSYSASRPLPYELRGWEEDDNTNIDFANQMNWDIKNLSLYFTGGNFMTDGYGMGFSTQLIVNENNITNESFKEIEFTVILGYGFQHKKDIKTKASILKSEGFKVKLVEKSDFLAKYLRDTDFAIISNGRTVFEVACMGVPVLSVAVNEREKSHSFVKDSNIGRHMIFKKKTFSKELTSNIEYMLHPVNRKNFKSNLKKLKLLNGVDKVIQIINDEYDKRK